MLNRVPSHLSQGILISSIFEVSSALGIVPISSKFLKCLRIFGFIIKYLEASWNLWAGDLHLSLTPDESMCLLEAPSTCQFWQRDCFSREESLIFLPFEVGSLEESQCEVLRSGNRVWEGDQEAIAFKYVHFHPVPFSARLIPNPLTFIVSTSL